jgi:hypothetical protein
MHGFALAYFNSPFLFPIVDLTVGGLEFQLGYRWIFMYG